jgi:hypothetical protein
MLIEDKIMNKLISIACASIILSSSAFGQDLYDGASYISTDADGNAMYVTSDFAFTSSADVITYTDETARVFAVGTFHPKGNTELGFGANTEGGLITDCDVGYETPVAEDKVVVIDGNDVNVNQGC